MKENQRESSNSRLFPSLMAKTYFVTGTDTGVGKTVLTCLLTRHFRASGFDTVAVKPFCSGGRADARLLLRAQGDSLNLNDINPWSFRAPLTPLLAGRLEERRVSKQKVLHYLRTCGARCEILLIEGAGGLLSPLGSHFDARDLIAELNATPIVVSPNRLGVINQVRLVLAALPAQMVKKALVALINNTTASLVTRTNPAMLLEFIPKERLTLIPRVRWPECLERSKLPAGVFRALERWNLKTDS